MLMNKLHQICKNGKMDSAMHWYFSPYSRVRNRNSKPIPFSKYSDPDFGPCLKIISSQRSRSKYQKSSQKRRKTLASSPLLIMEYRWSKWRIWFKIWIHLWSKVCRTANSFASTTMITDTFLLHGMAKKDLISELEAFSGQMKTDALEGSLIHLCRKDST